MISTTTLQHPATKQKIRGAARRAFFLSARGTRSVWRRCIGVAEAHNKRGAPFLRVYHHRDNCSPTKGRFVFIDAAGRDITGTVLHALRGERSTMRAAA